MGGCGIGASCRLDDIESVNEAGDQDAGVGVSRSCGVNDFTDETGNLDRFASDRAQETPVGSGSSDDQRPWAGLPDGVRAPQALLQASHLQVVPGQYRCPPQQRKEHLVGDVGLDRAEVDHQPDAVGDRQEPVGQDAAARVVGQVVTGGVDPVPGSQVDAFEILTLRLALNARGGDEGASAGGLDERGAGADVPDELLDE